MTYKTKAPTEFPFIWPNNFILFFESIKSVFLNINFVAHFSAHQQASACDGHTTPIITHLS
jgi:hypothetical protein